METKNKILGKRYLENCWVPHLLTEANKLNRVRICQQLLQMFGQNDFLYQLVTVDEIWIDWQNDGAFNNKSWRGRGENPATTPKRTLMNRKHLTTIFSDAKGVILMDILPRGQSIRADIYCEQLDRFVIAIQQQRRRLCHGGYHNIHFLHDNATPHTAVKTATKLYSIGFTILPHPPYSPDLAPSDFYLFSPLKSFLWGKNYNSAEEINADIKTWIDSKPREFFTNGIRKLPGRWRKFIEHAGNYFSHLSETDA